MALADVDRSIEAALDSTGRATAPAGVAAGDLLDALREVARGGKRLRAQLVLAAHTAHGGAAHGATARAGAVNVAAALELFQTAALVHDDVLDAAQTRRGKPTIHHSLAAQHRERAWAGDADRFGTAGAILAGDLALMASHRALGIGSAAVPHGAAPTVLELFADMAELCTAGQFLDMELAARPLESIADQGDDIVAVMRSKTASYTAEFPLALGAACANATPLAIQAMRAVGVPLGIAFQLRDDVLGLVGKPEVTGKPSGDDLREGKRTLLLHHAWSRGDSGVRGLLAASVGNAAATPAEIADAVAAVESTGAIEAVEEKIEYYVADARGALAAAERGLTDAGALEELERLIAATTRRTA